MLVVLCDGHKSTNKLQQKIVFWMHFYFLMKPHSYAREDQKGSKQVDNPMERLDECHTNSNERATHNERTQDAPVEHPVLVGRWHLEEGEEQQKDKDIINAERFLDQVAREEL